MDNMTNAIGVAVLLLLAVGLAALNDRSKERAYRKAVDQGRRPARSWANHQTDWPMVVGFALMAILFVATAALLPRGVSPQTVRGLTYGTIVLVSLGVGIWSVRRRARRSEAEDPLGSRSEPKAIALPFLAIRFPELEHLPAEQRQEILQRCIESESIRVLSKQARSYTVAVFVLMVVATLALPMAFSATGDIRRTALWAFLALPLLGFGAPAAIFLWNHLRTVRVLRALVAQELERLEP